MTTPLGFIGTLPDGGDGGLDDLIEIERPGAEPASYKIPLGAARPLRRTMRTFADSGAPIITSDKNTLILVDATDGPVVLALGAIAALGNFGVQVAKIDASANTVTVTAAGGDTINNNVAYVLTGQYRGVEVLAAVGTTAWLAVALNPIFAALDSPAFIGVPTAPTAAVGTNSPQIATTGFVRGEIAALVAASPAALDTLNELAAALGNDANFAATMAAALAAKAPLASPALTGTPIAPTAAVDTNTTQIATTAFVVGQAASAAPANVGAAATGSSLKYARQDHVHAIPNGHVTNAMSANVATATIKGRSTAGSGPPEDLTGAQATALLSPFGGDSGAGGTKGLVPAPAAGDAAAPKYLKADGTWAAAAFAFADNSATNAKLADMATQTIKGRNTAGSGDPEDLSVATVKSMLQLASGTYTPTFTAVSNCSGLGLYGAQFNYLRVGDMVTVSGAFAVDATNTSGSVWHISLPIPSNFTSPGQCAGAAAPNSNDNAALVDSEPTSDRAICVLMARTAGARSMSITFTYRIM